GGGARTHRRSDGGRGWPCDRELAREARLAIPARRALHDADLEQRKWLGGLIHRPRAARRAHVVRASGGGTYEPAGNAGGRFTRVRCDVPGYPGHYHATGDRVTLVVPGPGPPPAQLERPAAPGHCRERRRRGEQFLSRIPGRALSDPG